MNKYFCERKYTEISMKECKECYKLGLSGYHKHDKCVCRNLKEIEDE